VLQREFPEAVIVKLCVLASGSSGNCTLVATERTTLIVDIGLSCREAFRRLAEIGEKPESVDGVLISHEHSDHVSGLPVFLKKLNALHKKSGRSVPVFMTGATAQAVEWDGCGLPLERFDAGTRVTVGDIEVGTFTIPHDAADPVGFSFRAQGIQTGVVTDLGYIPDSIRFHLRGTDMLVLESNHDLEMLKVGPYPWAVKQRVMGRKGHLSNDVASEFIRRDLDARTMTLVLAHLSEHNNHPELARLAAAQALAARGLAPRLVIAGHGRPTEVFRI
jgi:phosphoribosyl 1,2-cyclic phosphodiesterase